MKIETKPGDYLLAAFAQPGWDNTPIVAIIANPDGTTRDVYIQPGDQTDAMKTLYTFSALATNRMTDEVARLLKLRRRG